MPFFEAQPDTEREWVTWLPPSPPAPEPARTAPARPVTEPARPKGPGVAKAKPRKANWKRPNRGRTGDLQALIRRALMQAEDGYSLSELASEVGITRQNVLYHAKKMAATGQLVLVFEPCDESGGLRLRCWDEARLVTGFRPGLRRAA